MYKDELTVCYKDFCIDARGKNADLLRTAFIFMLICVGIGTLARALK